MKPQSNGFSLLQDTYGGGFDATQAFVGDLANFHIWDRKLSVGEIYNLATCSSKAQVGNVFAWMETSLDIYGGASKWTFEACRQLNWTELQMEKNICKCHVCHGVSQPNGRMMRRLFQWTATGIFVNGILKMLRMADLIFVWEEVTEQVNFGIQCCLKAHVV